MKKILVSACLYGGKPVRYDAKSYESKDPLLLRWKEQGLLIPVCPELLGGLSVPREPSERQDGRVITKSGRDVTAEYRLGAELTVELARKNDVALAILKERSPACGSSLIYDGSFTGRRIPGEGVAAEALRNAGFKVFSEFELEEAEDFLKETE